MPGSLVGNSVSFDDNTIAQMLTNIYRGKYDTEADIEPSILEATRQIFSQSIDKGFRESDFDPEKAFRDRLHHSADVFSAFRVHNMTAEVASQLHDADGNLRSFAQFAEAVQPYISHQNRAWLQTEYDTAVRRAHDAADWQQFEAERDVLPNLKWLPTTSATPGEDHIPFWNTIRPIDDPFWDAHRPGDRWNCKCSLTSTDEQPTDIPNVPKDKQAQNNAQDGLRSNPGKSGELFSKDHPYFAATCSTCPFRKSKLAALWNDLTDRRDCFNCSGVDKKLKKNEKAKRYVENIKPIKVREYGDGGKEIWYADSEASKKADFAAIKTIARNLAKVGDVVEVMPRYHSKSEEYNYFYKDLIGTKYANKCPDLRINGKFYEYEGFVKPWTKDKIGRMLSHGFKQSSRIIINNNKGCSHRYLRKRIFDYLRLGIAIDEVLVYEKGNTISIYKKSGK